MVNLNDACTWKNTISRQKSHFKSLWHPDKLDMCDFFWAILSYIPSGRQNSMSHRNVSFLKKSHILRYRQGQISSLSGHIQSRAATSSQVHSSIYVNEGRHENSIAEVLKLPQQVLVNKHFLKHHTAIVVNMFDELHGNIYCY